MLRWGDHRDRYDGGSHEPASHRFVSDDLDRTHVRGARVGGSAGAVRISALAGDWPTFREHLDAMRSWYNRTGTATLIARVERLRALDPVQSNRPHNNTNETRPLTLGRDPRASAQNENGALTICTVTDVTNTDPKLPSR